MSGKEDLGMDMIVNGTPVSISQVKEEDLYHGYGAQAEPPTGTELIGNPVENPPMNNWSVNQPSPPHAKGMSGKEDLGMNMIVNGTPVSVAQGRAIDDPNGELGLDMKVDGLSLKIA
jgi:shikimate 5-dehydrogenase